MNAVSELINNRRKLVKDFFFDTEVLINFTMFDSTIQYITYTNKNTLYILNLQLITYSIYGIYNFQISQRCRLPSS